MVGWLAKTPTTVTGLNLSLEGGGHAAPIMITLTVTAACMAKSELQDICQDWNFQKGTDEAQDCKQNDGSVWTWKIKLFSKLPDKHLLGTLQNTVH